MIRDPGSHPPQLWAVYFLPVLAGLDCFQPGPVLSRCGADFREFSRPCMSTQPHSIEKEVKAERTRHLAMVMEPENSC